RRHTRFSRDWSSDVCSSDLLTIEISGGRFLFRASGSRVLSPGFLVLYQEGVDEEKKEEELALPEVAEKAVLSLVEVKGEQHFTRSEERRVGKECRSRWTRRH